MPIANSMGAMEMITPTVRPQIVWSTYDIQLVYEHILPHE